VSAVIQKGFDNVFMVSAWRTMYATRRSANPVVVSTMTGPDDVLSPRRPPETC